MELFQLVSTLVLLFSSNTFAVEPQGLPGLSGKVFFYGGEEPNEDSSGCVIGDGSCAPPPSVVSRDWSFYASNPPSKGKSTPNLPAKKLPRPKVKYDIVFIHSNKDEKEDPIIVPPPAEKTVVVVLEKEPKDKGPRVIEVPSQESLAPEVHFIDYKEGTNMILPGGIDLKTALSGVPSASKRHFVDPTKENNAPPKSKPKEELKFPAKVSNDSPDEGAMMTQSDNFDRFVRSHLTLNDAKEKPTTEERHGLPEGNRVEKLPKLDAVPSGPSKKNEEQASKVVKYIMKSAVENLQLDLNPEKIHSLKMLEEISTTPPTGFKRSVNNETNILDSKNGSLSNRDPLRKDFRRKDSKIVRKAYIGWKGIKPTESPLKSVAEPVTSKTESLLNHSSLDSSSNQNNDMKQKSIDQTSPDSTIFKPPSVQYKTNPYFIPNESPNTEENELGHPLENESATTASTIVYGKRYSNDVNKQEASREPVSKVVQDRIEFPIASKRFVPEEVPFKPQFKKVKMKQTETGVIGNQHEKKVDMDYGANIFGNRFVEEGPNYSVTNFPGDPLTDTKRIGSESEVVDAEFEREKNKKLQIDQAAEMRTIMSSFVHNWKKGSHVLKMFENNTNEQMEKDIGVTTKDDTLLKLIGTREWIHKTSSEDMQLKSGLKSFVPTYLNSSTHEPNSKDSSLEDIKLKGSSKEVYPLKSSDYIKVALTGSSINTGNMSLQDFNQDIPKMSFDDSSMESSRMSLKNVSFKSLEGALSETQKTAFGKFPQESSAEDFEDIFKTSIKNSSRDTFSVPFIKPLGEKQSLKKVENLSKNFNDGWRGLDYTANHLRLNRPVSKASKNLAPQVIPEIFPQKDSSVSSGRSNSSSDMELNLTHEMPVQYTIGFGKENMKDLPGPNILRNKSSTGETTRNIQISNEKYIFDITIKEVGKENHGTENETSASRGATTIYGKPFNKDPPISDLSENGESSDSGRSFQVVNNVANNVANYVANTLTEKFGFPSKIFTELNLGDQRFKKEAKIEDGVMILDTQVEKVVNSPLKNAVATENLSKLVDLFEPVRIRNSPMVEPNLGSVKEINEWNPRRLEPKISRTKFTPGDAKPNPYLKVSKTATSDALQNRTTTLIGEMEAEKNETTSSVGGITTTEQPKKATVRAAIRL